MHLEAVPYSHPDAAALIDEIQQEYVVRYGGPDRGPVCEAEFSPPSGLFLVGYVSGAATACGGFRAHGADAEVKRLFVRPSHRGQGLARAVLAELEREARSAGYPRMILETGSRQPEALALYRSAGYADVERFGYYADSPSASYLGKPLLP